MNNHKKRIYTSQFKTNLVKQYLRGQKQQSEICRENAINPNLLSKWVRQVEENLHLLFENNHSQKESQKQLDKLQQIIGKQTIEIDFLKRGLQRF